MNPLTDYPPGATSTPRIPPWATPTYNSGATPVDGVTRTNPFNALPTSNVSASGKNT